MFISNIYYPADIFCPGSYLCDVVADVTLRSCVEIQQVCDGTYDCPGKDDEIECGKSRPKDLHLGHVEILR